MHKIAALVLVPVFLCAGMVRAAEPASAPSTGSSAAQTSTEMTEGEVRKVDIETRKITLRHGEIKNLGMPAMSMVFQVKDPAMLDQVKAGDKVRFRAEKMNGALTVTNIEALK